MTLGDLKTGRCWKCGTHSICFEGENFGVQAPFCLSQTSRLNLCHQTNERWQKKIIFSSAQNNNVLSRRSNEIERNVLPIRLHATWPDVNKSFEIFSLSNESVHGQIAQAIHVSLFPSDHDLRHRFTLNVSIDFFRFSSFQLF